MVKSSAATVQEYLDELPKERRAVVAQVRERILQYLPTGYQESMGWGMIDYQVPLGVFPHTYNGAPLSYLALAAQKNGYSLYMMGIYGNPEREAQLVEGFAKAGKKLDKGKGCIRFKNAEDLPFEVIGPLIAGIPMETFIERYEASRGSKGSARSSTDRAQGKSRK